MSTTAIEPFKPPSPLADITELEGWYIYHASADLLARLLWTAGDVWLRSSTEERTALLNHLADEIDADQEKKRFRTLREVRNLYDSRDDFVRFYASCRALGLDVPEELVRYVMLYVDLRKGRRAAVFSTEVFYRQYQMFNLPSVGSD